jgi:6-pyruvoyltetrahydropterin/6-carboxytetrahydropterin synthase
MLITRRLEFDAGHRIPHHGSQCRHLHGHRYALEVTLRGDIIETEGVPEQGMVKDYGAVRDLMFEHVVSRWDHAFLVHSGDRVVREFLDSLPGHKTVVLDVVPTAENLAQVAFDTLDRAFRGVEGQSLRLERVRLYETPNNWADAVRPAA